MINTQLIEELRIKHGYSQGQIAKLLGYDTHSAYSKKIKDAKRFTVEDVVKLCNLFMTEPNQILIIEKVGK